MSRGIAHHVCTDRCRRYTPRIGDRIYQRGCLMEKCPPVQGQCACKPGCTLGLAPAVSTVHICRDQGVIQISPDDSANSVPGRPGRRSGSNKSYSRMMCYFFLPSKTTLDMTMSKKVSLFALDSQMQLICTLLTHPYRHSHGARPVASAEYSTQEQQF